MKASELNKSRPDVNRVILYGAPFTGKTTLACSLAEKYNITLIDTEEGYKAALKLPSAVQDRIDVIPIADNKDTPIAIETTLKLLRGNKVSVCVEHGKVMCLKCKKAGKPEAEYEFNALPRNHIVVLDTLTQVTQSCINNVTLGQPDDYKMKTDDWGNVSKIIGVLGGLIQSAKYNIICISHEIDTEKLDSPKERICPIMGSRAYSSTMAKLFDHAILCKLANGRQSLYSVAGSVLNTVVGSRTGFDASKQPIVDLFT